MSDGKTDLLVSVPRPVAAASIMYPEEQSAPLLLASQGSMEMLSQVSVSKTDIFVSAHQSVAVSSTLYPEKNTPEEHTPEEQDAPPLLASQGSIEMLSQGSVFLNVNVILVSAH